jgi:putative ABC transport system substrate-binding protein
MRRRDFINVVGGTAAAWPLKARAQQAKTPVVGLLGNTTSDEYAYLIEAFRKGLSEGGYVEGQNLAIEYRWAEGQSGRLPALAAELARRHVDVIMTSGGTAPALAAKAATSTIPIVFAFGTAPLKPGSLPVLTGRAAILQVSASSRRLWPRSDWNCCAIFSPKQL